MNKRIITIIMPIIIIAIISVIVAIPLSTTTNKVAMKVIDDRGKEVIITNYPPTKIISIAPSNTEILFSLGLDDKIIGVTQYCDYPPKVKRMVDEGKIAIVGGFANPSIEKIIALMPDVVFATHTVQLKVIESLEEKGIRVVFLDPKNIQDILNNILIIGKVTGKEIEAKKLVDEMKQRIDYVISKTQNVSYKPRVYYEVWHDPLMSIGPDTYVSQLIEMAGGKNIFSDSNLPYPIVNSESIISRDPEIIIIKIGYMGGIAKDEIVKRSGWNVISAVKNGKIYEINEDLVIRPGPRIVEGLEILAKIIHPELF
ncbi:MAG: cobalamin-binding protein [Nitrososphaerales archaeon]